MRLINQLTTWRRTEWLLLAAIGALFLGAALPWYTLPDSTLAAFETSLWLPMTMRLLPVVAVFAAWHILRSGVAPARSRLTLWGVLLVALLFPFLVSTFSPAVTYIAAAFDLQRDSVAYHIETHFPEVQSQWKQSIRLDPFDEVQPYIAEGFARRYVDPLQTLPVGRTFAVDNSDFFQGPSWDRVVIEGMHYTPSFLACTGWGWPVTIAALAVALFAAYLAAPEGWLPDLRTLTPWVLGGLSVVILMLLLPTATMRQMSRWQSRGMDGRASRAAHLLYACYPPVRADVAFLTQMAECDVRANRGAPAQLNFAKGVEYFRNSQLDLARTYFERSLAAENNFLARGYLSATLLRQGVQLFEQAHPAAAATTFELARQAFPEHIQGTYCAMIAEAANANFAASSVAADDLRRIQQYFRLPGIAALGQAHLHDAWANYRAGHLDEAWHAYRRAVDRGTWE